MAEAVKVGFERTIAVLPLSALLPLKTVPDAIRQSAKFKQIAKSVGEVGIIEPVVVARSKDQKGKYLLLDGHMRHAVLVAMDATEVRCLIADDDEGYTYNKRINRLATIQEHLMIVRAIERGVSEEKLAKLLDDLVQRLAAEGYLNVDAPPQVPAGHQHVTGPGGLAQAASKSVQFNLTDKAIDFLGYKSLRSILGSLG